MKRDAKAGGKLAEALAADYLQQRGLRLIERNYSCRLGEIDLILADGPVLVFVEVRLRRNPGFGGAAASITAAKRQRILRAARHYLSGKAERACRFDVVLLDALGADHIEWIKDAFGEE
ncbi:MAG: YraN family protein [Burkholderiales bacterium]|nr:YraN family protein [Burkholderiales bacterium]